MTFEQFKDAVIEANQQNPRWRLGQSAFNVLYQNRPDLSEQVRATNLDPFHDDEILSEFYRWVEENW